MNCFLRRTVQHLVTVPCASLHTSQVLRGAVWKKYQWTPWPWPVGMKHLRNRWNPSRPGYQRLRRNDRPRPGSEEGQISGPYLKKFSVFFQQETLKLLRLFARQCEVYTAQRIRRAHQICLLYGNLYNRQTAGTLLKNFFWTSKNRVPGSFMAFMGAAVFALEKPEAWVVEISDSDIERCFDDLAMWSKDVKNHKNGPLPEWESVTKTKNCDVWVKIPSSAGPPEYRALGSFTDIPATTFFQTQLDLAYRRQWDKLVIKLEVVDKDEESGTEVLQWVTHFPFPFDPREYVYQRRYTIDEKRKAMMVISKGCDHPKIPGNSKYVRVRNYYSALLIRPHGKFEEDGFDYVLVYIDDPQTFLPKMAVQYAAKSSLPDFMAKLHDAAKVMLKKFGRPPPSISLSSSVVENKENIVPTSVSVSRGDVFGRSTARMPAP